MSSARLLWYSTEDRIVRKLIQYPRKKRVNSFPYLNSDTYSYLCDITIDKQADFLDIESMPSDSTVYVNGNLLIALEQEFQTSLSKRFEPVSAIVIGDADNPPTTLFLKDIQKYCKLVACVNVPSNIKGVVPLPLGLESQRYRSAGQIRDFKRIPSFSMESRSIGILVAWNDATNPKARILARREINKSNCCLEISKRVPARYIHALMRRTLLVPSPPGNGKDTHRFWESLYLGALPVILKRDEIPAYSPFPFVAIEQWSELSQMDTKQLREIYSSKVSALESFRNNSHRRMVDLFSYKMKSL
jgi:hypothetical protein